MIYLKTNRRKPMSVNEKAAEMQKAIEYVEHILEDILTNFQEEYLLDDGFKLEKIEMTQDTYDGVHIDIKVKEIES